MNNKIKIAIIAVSVLFCITLFIGPEEVTTFVTVKPTFQEIKNEVEFSSNVYPKKFVKYDLGDVEEIKKVYVKEGDSVKKGDTLVQLDDSDEREQLNSAKSSFYQLAASRDSLKSAQNSVKTTIRSLSNQNEDDYEDMVEMINDLEISDEAKASLLSALESSKTSAKSVYSAVSGLISGVDLTSSTQSGINTLATQIKSLEKQVEARKIKAPFTGTIVFVKSDNYSGQTSSTSDVSSILSSMGGATATGGMDISSLMGGSSASPTKANGLTTDPNSGNYIVLVDSSSYSMIATFNAEDIVKVTPEMQVKFTSRVIDTPINGIVTKVGKIPSTSENDEPMYPVTMTFVDVVAGLPLGSKVDGAIKIEEKAEALTVPYDVVLLETRNSGSVYVKKGNNKEKVDVKIGIINTTKMEIVSGLDPNSDVIVSEEQPKTQIRLRPWLRKLLKIE